MKIMVDRAMKRIGWLCLGLFIMGLAAAGCAHYPVNPPLKQVDPGVDHRRRFMGAQERAEQLLMLLTFSGGGTRAAAFSYGVLEELKKTEVTIDGTRRRLLDEVDGISSVSGGSFTAGYYGLFGDRIFEDFETRFLKKDIEGALATRTFFNPVNWIRLSSAYFDRSDLAAEYYDKHLFNGGTFSDMTERKGPVILMNATDMVSGIRVGFSQETFDMICSDLSRFPVARAAAASSAVPVLLSPITLRNHAGSCGYKMPEIMEKTLREHDASTWRFHEVNDVRPYLDAEKRPFIHLVDGGVADNLGLRAVLDRVLALGDFWTTLKYFGSENVRKVIFIVVNSEKELSDKWYLSEKSPPFKVKMKSFSVISMARYNYDTVMLLRDRFGQWTRDVQQNRCGNGPISTEPGACGDIQFYLIEVKFDALKDEAERAYLSELPTSFKLPSVAVDRLRDAAHRILVESDEFQRLLRDLK
jgi:NTE family protein